MILIYTDEYFDWTVRQLSNVLSSSIAVITSAAFNALVEGDSVEI